MEDTNFPQPVDTPAMHISTNIIHKIVTADFGRFLKATAGIAGEEYRGKVAALMNMAWHFGYQRAMCDARMHEMALDETIAIDEFFDTVEEFIAETPEWAEMEWDTETIEDTPVWWAENVWEHLP